MTYYIYQYTYIIQAVTDFGKRYQELDVSMSRINEILFNEKYEDVKYGNKSLDNVKGIIKFNNVSFSYPNEKEILNNFNITFEPNKKIAIVGSSGEGKSTLFNLITRLFDPTSGTITLDDIDIKDLTEESLRKSISIIRQEPFIFNRTILENFKLIDPKVTLKEVKKYFEDKVYKTVIPRNVRLSEAPSYGMPICMYDARSKGSRCYDKFAKEFIKKNEIPKN